MNTMALPKEISLDWIPLPKVFWINHASTNPASFLSSGELSLISTRMLEKAEQGDTNLGYGDGKVVVRSVSTSETNLIYTFKGGKISSDKIKTKRTR